MTSELNKFIGYNQHVLDDLKINIQVAIYVNIDSITLDIFNKSISLVSELENLANQGKLKANHLNQFRQNVGMISSILPYKIVNGYNDPSFINSQNDISKIHAGENLKQASKSILGYNEQLEFSILFFDKVGYFDNNIVAIGANGSGKTTLSNKFKVYFQDNGVVISAQRILLVPRFDAISNPIITADKLKQYQVKDKTNKGNEDFRHLQQEFGVVLTHLLAENISIGNNYRKRVIKSIESGKDIPNPKLTKLDIALKIWNNLIEHRTISCDDGINIMAKSSTGQSYPLMQMSDGEKVLLYLIAQVLQAPDNGFIVIDEPEMYLHKTILKKLWDDLESKREDCIFIYLTHDLDFATSRTTAKKIWIKSFSPPDRWQIEEIPAEEIPEALMMELLGSRKNVLFCEGTKGKTDERIYSILFPELTIMPVGTCFDVINHTKAFNKLKSVNTNAFGLIDSDHHDSSRLEKLKENNIFSFNVAEVENLFLDTDFFEMLANSSLSPDLNIELLKSDVINELDKQKEVQAANYVSAKINYYFNDSNFSKGNTLTELENNYQEFLKKISIDDWYAQRLGELNKIISDQDYEKVLVSYNNKGLRSIANKHLNISNFKDRSINLLYKDNEAVIALLKYFPEEIKAAGMKQELKAIIPPSN
ncbi:MAG: ATP-binding protein [Taibaiella sp.]|nr:ATP-binding protein [Taibaiella sp.]